MCNREGLIFPSRPEICYIRQSHWSHSTHVIYVGNKTYIPCWQFLKYIYHMANGQCTFYELYGEDVCCTVRMYIPWVTRYILLHSLRFAKNHQIWNVMINLFVTDIKNIKPALGMLMSLYPLYALWQGRTCFFCNLYVEDGDIKHTDGIHVFLMAYL